jgi:hypothetical protein
MTPSVGCGVALVEGHADLDGSRLTGRQWKNRGRGCQSHVTLAGPRVIAGRQPQEDVSFLKVGNAVLVNRLGK